MEKIKLIPDTAIPWKARGPGWSNSGVTAMVRIEGDGIVREDRLTLYGEHFDPVMLSLATTAREEIERQFANALLLKEKKTKYEVKEKAVEIK